MISPRTAAGRSRRWTPGRTPSDQQPCQPVRGLIQLGVGDGGESLTKAVASGVVKAWVVNKSGINRPGPRPTGLVEPHQNRSRSTGTHRRSGQPERQDGHQLLQDPPPHPHPDTDRSRSNRSVRYSTICRAGSSHRVRMLGGVKVRSVRAVPVGVYRASQRDRVVPGSGTGCCPRRA